MSAASVDNSAYAQPSNVLSQDVVNKIDPYVEVKNNKYVLNDDVKKVITYAEYVSAQEVIAHTNQLINGSSFVINKSTKTATLEFEINNSGKSVRVLPSTEDSKIQPRAKHHFGVNKVEFGWNYIRVFIDKRTAKAVASGGLTGLTAIITAAVGSDGGPIVAAIGAFLSSTIGDNIKGGVWFDVNWILTGINHYPVITQWGWQ